MVLPLDGRVPVRYHAVPVKWFLVSMAIAGCAIAGEGNHIIGGIAMDAPVQETLTQTTSDTVAPLNSFGCVTNGVTFQNSYYRVFALADYNITTTLHVTQVDFGIQTAAAGSGATTQPATLNVGTYGVIPQGTTLDLAQIRSINSVSIQIPNGSATRMTVPIAADIPPTTQLIVELAIPDGTASGNKFFVGTNTQGEKWPGYTLGPDCNIKVPTTMKSIADTLGFGEVDLVMTVTGTR
jgi:hypothetical protein